MIYKNFDEWADGQWLEDGEPRKQAYTHDELLLIEMGWNYGFDAARLAQPEPVLVTPHEFVKQVEGKENMRGIPVMMARWPMQEWGDSKVTNPEFVAEQKAMNEALRSMVHPEPEPAVCPKEPANIEELYTAPPQREWVGLTDEEIADIICDDRWQSRPELMILAALAKAKEKNT